jgi:hypothetical protein
MITRRQFVACTTGAVGGLATLQGCSSGTSAEAYELAARRTWRHAEGDTSDPRALRRELIRYATLAPSSHNTQCWKFHIEEQGISIFPDLSRRCPAVDPDDHHLFVSLGCAAENLIQAALANGLQANAGFDAGTGTAIRLALEPTRAIASPLYLAIPERQSTRAEYDGKPLSNEDLGMLERAGTGKGVRLILITERAAMERVLEYVVQGNTAQINDPAFVDELKAWIRFSGEEAVRTGDGLFAASSGNPSAPRWLGSRLFSLLLTAKSENEKYAKHVRSSAGIAVFVSDTDDKAHWVEVGRCYERFALQSAALGIRNAFLNQPLEVSALRPQFAAFLGVHGRRPDLIVRFGRGPKMPPSLRRPLQAVLV